MEGKTTRWEEGRLYLDYDFQDNGRTLKVFVGEKNE